MKEIQENPEEMEAREKEVTMARRDQWDLEGQTANLEKGGNPETLVKEANLDQLVHPA